MSEETDILVTISVVTLLIVVLIASVFIAVLTAMRQRSAQEMKLTQTKLEYEKELRRTESEVSEQLMNQFAREIHDNIGHILTCIRLELENKKIDHPSLQKILEPMETYLDDASKQLRLLSRSLNTDYVSTIGFHHALVLEIERQRHLKKFEIQFESDEAEIDLDKNQQLIIFRVVQEIFQNALRHSKATLLSISLNNKRYFQLDIYEDGVGFDVQKVLHSPSASGLTNILKRCELAQLNCQIDSTPGQGCHYSITAIITNKT